MTAPTSKSNQTTPAQRKPESAAAAASRTAPVASQPKQEKPKVPALDFGKLTITDSAAPVRKSSRKRADNPLVPVLRESWAKRTGDKGAGKSVTVPTPQATELTNLIRYAANQVSADTGEQVGSAIVAKDNGNGTTTVTFAAKRRRNRKTKNADQAAPAAAPATAPATSESTAKK